MDVQQSLGEGPARDAVRPLYRFDIGPQSLNGAVRAFSDVTGQALLVDQSLLVGRTSPGVNGEFTPEDALSSLLAGTGLVQRYTADQAFTLVPIDAAGSTVDHDGGDGQEDSGPVDPVAEAYGALLQSAVEASLCRSDATRPGAYRLVMQLWIGADGTVERTRLISGSGSTTRDTAINAAMTRLRLDPPPPSVVKPVTLILLPRTASRLPVCAPPVAMRDRAAW